MKTKEEVIIRRKNVVGKVNVKKVNFNKISFERKASGQWGEVELTAKDIKKLLGGRISGSKVLNKQKINYPTYLYTLINSINKISGACKSRNVGKLHIMFKQRKFRSLGEWKKWYNKKYPKAASKAVDIIYNALEKAILMDKEMVEITYRAKRAYRHYIRKFVENLIYNQTYSGLKIQEVILIKMGKILKQNYKWSTGSEDSKGIDGYIGNIPVSIKPVTSNVKKKAGVKKMYYTIDEVNEILTFTFPL